MHGRKPPTEQPSAGARGRRIAVVRRNKASGRGLKRSSLTCGGSSLRCMVTGPFSCRDYMGVAQRVSILIDVKDTRHSAARRAARRAGCLSFRRSCMSASHSLTEPARALDRPRSCRRLPWKTLPWQRLSQAKLSVGRSCKASSGGR